MALVNLSKFTGILPKFGSTNLPDNAGQRATNVKLYSGEIRPWSKAEAVTKVSRAGIKTIFKLDGGSGKAVWCEWFEDTDVCYSPIADRTDSRIYYSQEGVCRKTNWAMCTDGEGPCPRKWLNMGVPAPVGKLTVTARRVDTSAQNTENRVYLYTYVSTFGEIEEESAPSDPVDVVCDITQGDVSITGFANPPTDGYNITKVRIYRAVTGNTTAVYMLVDEIALDSQHHFPSYTKSLNGVTVQDSAYVDSSSVVQLGKELDSFNYTPPPEGLRGLVSMPNGFLAGFIGNEVWFSEPNKPHAWPMDYMMTTDAEIVGLGVYGTTLVVTTTRQPYTISGTHPASMTQEKQPMFQPCVSKRSIAYDQYGVIYASPYGLVAIAGGQMDVFTRPILTQNEWQEYLPSTMVGVMYNNLYMVAYRTASTPSMLLFSRGDEPALVEYEFAPSAMHVERATGRLFCLNEVDNTIYLLDGQARNKEDYIWKSKRFVFPYWTSFSAMKLDADYSVNAYIDDWRKQTTAIVESNQTIYSENLGSSIEGDLNSCEVNAHDINGSLLSPVPTLAEYRSVTVTIYADSKLVYTKTMRSFDAVRLPAVKAFAWEVQINGSLDVRAFAMATTMRELASVM